MNGRVENDLRIFKQIENRLVDCPEYVISWYFYLKANENSATSCKDFINKIIRYLYFINPNIALVSLSDLNENNITQYMNSIKYKEDGTETSISYRQCIWSCLKNFYEFLYKRNYIPINFFEASGINRPKGNDLDRINNKRVLLTKDEFQRILNAVENGVGSAKARGYQKTYKNRDKAIILLFMTTGMRKTALEEINVDDVNLEKREIVLIDKGHETFTYCLTEELAYIIDQWLIDRYFLLGRKDNGALFISKENKRMCGNSIAKLVDKYAYAALGYHISPHKLRSGLISIMYEETHDIEFCRRMIGHADIGTTQRYIVTNNDERKRTAQVMNNITPKGD